MHKDHRFHALDSFRGLCALAVVVYHLRIYDSFTELAFFRHSYALVAFFFVLSGFVLTHVYGSRMAFNFRHFFISRTFRLFPLHIFMLGIFIVLEFGKVLAYDQGISFNHEPFSGKSAPAQILPNLFLLQSWTHWTNPLSFNFPAWSISIEYYTYMLFALTLALIGQRRFFLWLALCGWAFALIYRQNEFFTQEALRGVFCFFAGALCYRLFAVVAGRVKPRFMVFTLIEGVSLLVAGVLMVADIEQKFLVVCLSFCVVVVAFAFEAGAFSRLCTQRLFRLLGKLSYSIYLTHAAVLFCVVSMFMVLEKVLGVTLTFNGAEARHLDTGNVLLNNLTAALVVLAVVFISSFTYQYIELKGQAYGRSLIGRKPALQPL